MKCEHLCILRDTNFPIRNDFNTSIRLKLFHKAANINVYEQIRQLKYQEISLYATMNCSAHRDLCNHFANFVACIHF